MGKKPDAAKARYWQKIIRAAAQSGLSIREFCRQRKLHEGQFYWWQRQLATRQTRQEKPTPVPASFALVSEDMPGPEAGIELVLAGGRRLRIGKGVDEETLRTVLAAVEPGRC